MNATEASPLSAKPAKPRRDFAARLFGYDVFISFALGPPPRGSLSYASDLARRLRERDFTVYFSEDEAPPGEKLDGTLRAALHGSRTLVIVANRATLAEPRWVRTEVESFRSLTPERPIIPISVGGALQDPELGAAAAQWLPFADRIWLDEAGEAAASGIVSADVVDRLTLAPGRLRSNVKWRWLVRAVGATLLGLVVSLAIAAKLARDNERSARAGELAARATAAMAQDPDQALQHALASLNLKVTAEGERALRQAVQESSMTAVFDGGCAPQSADFGPGGHYVMSLCADGSARVWDSVTAESVLRLAGTEEQPVIARWGVDESAVYVAEPDGTVKVASLPDGRELLRLPANGPSIGGMVVDPPLGQLLVWREGDGLRAYALADLAPRWHNAAPASDVRWVKVSRDGTELAVLWPDPVHDGLGSVRYFDARDGKLLAGLGGQPEIYARGSTFDGEGRRMLRLGDDEISEHYNAVTWDLRAGQRVAELNRPAGRFWSGAIDAEGNAYIGYWGNVVQIWHPGQFGSDRQPWAELSGHAGRVVDIDVRAQDDDTRVLTASEDGTARLWRPTPRESQGSSADPSELRVLRGHRGAVTLARFSPDGRRAVTVGSDRTARVWRLEDNYLGPVESDALLSRAADAEDDVPAIPVDAAWRRFVLQQGQRVQLIERDGGRVACEIDAAPLDLAMPKVYVDGGGRRLLLVHEEGGRAVLFDLPGCRELRRLPLPAEGPPLEVSFNASAKAALLRFGEYHVLDLESGRDLGALLGAQHIFEYAAFVDEGAVLAVDAWGQYLVRWSGPPYGQGQKLELPFPVESFVMSPDRQRLAVRNAAGVTALVHPGTGAVLHRWTMQAMSLAFSDDGRRVAASGTDTAIRAWSVQDGSVLVDLPPGTLEQGYDLHFSGDGQRLFGDAGVWAVPGGQRLDARAADASPWIDGIWFRRERGLGLETVRSVQRCVTCEPLQLVMATARQRLARRSEAPRAQELPP